MFYLNMGFQNAEVGLFIDFYDHEWLRLVCKEILDVDGNSVKDILFNASESEEFEKQFEHLVENEKLLTFILHDDIDLEGDKTFEADCLDIFYDTQRNCEFRVKPMSSPRPLIIRMNNMDFSGISLANVGDGASETFKKDDVDTLFKWVEHLKSQGRLPEKEYEELTLLTNFNS